MNKRRNGKMKLSTINVMLVLVGVFCISLGYSSFYSEANISDLMAMVRLQRDMRITSFNIDSMTDNGVSMYEEYNEHSLSFDITLPESASSVTYKFKVINFGNVPMGIRSIKGLPEALTYEFKDYDLKSMLCDNKDNCLTGMEKDIYLVIKYKDGSYDAASTSFNVDLDVEFSPFYKVGFDANNGVVTPTSKNVMYKEVYGNLPSPSRVGYNFINWTYNGDVIKSDNIMETGGDHSLIASWQAIKYPVTFTGNNIVVNPSNLEVAYDGSNTFKIKPSGGYLNSLTCDGGYTLSSFDTGKDARGEQTVTIYNNGNTNGSTCQAEVKSEAPYCTWSDVEYIRTNETVKATLSCSSGSGFTSTNITTSNFTSSNVDVGKITKVTLKNSTTTTADYEVELRGIAYGNFDVTLNSGVFKDTNNKQNVATKTSSIKVVGFEVNSTSVSLNLASTKTFQINVIGGNYGNVTYTSSDPSIATVSASGLITAKAIGDTKITVKEGDYGLTKEINVSVSSLLVINYELTYLKSSNTATTIASGSSYSTTLSPTNTLLYGRPSSIRVYVGGSLTSNYTYNSVDGKLTISNVNGDLKIVATANVLSNENISFEKPKQLGTISSKKKVSSVSITQSYQLRIFSFKPSTTKTYTFWSEDANASSRSVDPYAYLFVESDTVTIASLDAAAEHYAVAGDYAQLQSQCLVYNDDGGSGYNFNMSYSCEAGKTYFLVIRTFTPNKIQSFLNIYIQ